MHKSRFITSVVIFVAGFALSTIVDVRHLAFPAKGTLSNPAAQEVAAQKTPTTVAWEYRVATKRVFHDKKWDLDFELSQLGAQGFEIHSVTQSSPDTGAYLAVVLRRPKQ